MHRESFRDSADRYPAPDGRSSTRSRAASQRRAAPYGCPHDRARAAGAGGSVGCVHGGELTRIEARALRLAGEVYGLLELEEFRDGLLAALGSEIPSDFVSLNGIAPDPALNWSVAQPAVPERYHEPFARFALQNPLAEWHLRTRDGRPLRLSDIVTAEQLHATDLYREVYAEIGVEYQIAFTLPSPSERILAIALSRTHEDYTDTERDLLALARPHLIQAYRNVLDFTDRHRQANHSGAQGPDEGELRGLGLTPAQARVLRRIAMGSSTDGVARELGIAPRTVHKHLERIYARLGVTDRAAAAERAWAAVRATPTGA